MVMVGLKNYSLLCAGFSIIYLFFFSCQKIICMAQGYMTTKSLFTPNLRLAYLVSLLNAKDQPLKPVKPNSLRDIYKSCQKGLYQHYLYFL